MANIEQLGKVYNVVTSQIFYLKITTQPLSVIERLPPAQCLWQGSVKLLGARKFHNGKLVDRMLNSISAGRDLFLFLYI